MRGMRLSALLAAIVLLLTPAMGTAHHGGRDIGSMAIWVSPVWKVASRLSFTASALNSSPLWKVMPSLVTRVHSVKSSLGVIDSARYGASAPSSS